MLEQDLDDDEGFGNEDDVVSENKRLKDEQSKRLDIGPVVMQPSKKNTQGKEPKVAEPAPKKSSVRNEEIKQPQP